MERVQKPRAKRSTVVVKNLYPQIGYLIDSEPAHESPLRNMRDVLELAESEFGRLSMLNLLNCHAFPVRIACGFRRSVQLPGRSQGELCHKVQNQHACP